MLFWFAAACALLLLPTPAAAQEEAPELGGEMKRWHPVTLTFTGPEADEAGEVNPFRNYRLDVLFEHAESDARLLVPGYFAADGDAAETGATSGDQWRVHFTPSETGTWTYAATLRNGPDVALTSDATSGTLATLEGASGTLTIAETDKTGRDFRGKGLLRYNGTRYLHFDNGEPFLKGGADSPETLLAYEGFDGTRALAPPGQQREGEAHTAPLHRYEPT